MMKKIIEVGCVLKIVVYDYLVIGKGWYVSFKLVGFF